MIRKQAAGEGLGVSVNPNADASESEEKHEQLNSQMHLDGSDLNQFQRTFVGPLSCLLLADSEVGLWRHQCVCHAPVVSDSGCQRSPLDTSVFQRFVR